MQSPKRAMQKADGDLKESTKQTSHREAEKQKHQAINYSRKETCEDAC
jgi:hypothetical protein